MPRKYNYKTKKSFKGRRTYNKRRPTASQNAKRISGLVKKVRQDSPSKVSPITVYTAQDIWSTPTIENLTTSTTMLQTLTSPKAKNLLHSIWIKGMITQQTVGTNTQFFRIALVVDKRKFDNDTAPTWLDVFETADVFSHRIESDSSADNWIKKGSFKVIFDKTYNTVSDVDSTINNKRLVNIYRKFSYPLQVRDYTGYQSNQVYLMFMGTGGLATTADFDYQLRLLTSHDE